VENNKGITNMVIPEGLTLGKVLQIAVENSVPIARLVSQILPDIRDVPVEQTCVLFLTNSIFVDTRHSSARHERDVKTIGQECGIAIQRHEIRNFMALLVLTHISSSETPPIRLYSSSTFTSLLEKGNNTAFFGGFGPRGLHAFYCMDSSSIGVGAWGSSEDIGT
jgi:hypothetical protein